MRLGNKQSATVGAVAALAAAGALVACTGATTPGSSGVVTGQAPVCSGPGPNTNLKPATVISAVRSDGLTRSTTVLTAGRQDAYRLALPAGRYEITSYSGSIEVTVRAGRVVRHADLPQPGCL